MGWPIQKKPELRASVPAWIHPFSVFCFMAFLIAVHPFIRKNANLLFVFALAGIYGISDRIPGKRFY